MRINLTLSAAFAGVLFGTGLILSGMTNPLKVQAFLDLAGDWNPALALVMASAIGTATSAFLWVKKRGQTLLGDKLDVANKKSIDLPLIAGSAIFGIGWGISGICPGPGLLVAATGNYGALIFVVCMSLGMLFRQIIAKRIAN